MIGIIWFVLVATVCIVVWRLHVSDKRKEQEDKDK